MERTNKMRTTTFTKRVIEAHMLRRSKVGVSCSRNTANTYKVATIRLLLNFQVAPRPEPGDHQECLLILLPGLAHLSHDRRAGPYYWLREKITSMVVSTSTGSPLRRVG